VSACLVIVVAGWPAAPSQFISRRGTQLLLNGKVFHFTGLNIYNANSVMNCSYTLGTGNQLDQELNIIGSGQSVLRAWFYQHLATSNGVRDWTVFDHTLQVAAAHHQRVIVTLADQWGSCDTLPSTYKTLAWYQSGYRTQVSAGMIVPYRQWVQEVVSRYANNPTVAFWQLMNEAEARVSSTGPCREATAARALRGFADDVGGAIATIDRNHLVSLGTLYNRTCGLQGSDYQMVHASRAIDLCEYHDYGYPTTAMPAYAQTIVEHCRALQKPVFVGESGIVPAAAGGYQQRAASFQSKFRAQFGAGVVGEMIWAWSVYPNPSASDVGPGDPVLSILAQY
jgi:endo-1,4-beta-mannosidase